MRRALVVALATLLVSAYMVFVAPAAPADAWPKVRYCKARTPAAPVAVGHRILAGGSSWCIGSGSATITTQCQLEKLQGIGSRLRWVPVAPTARGVRSWVWTQACKVTAPREPGRWRVRVRVIASGPNVVKQQGWNQSGAVTIR